MLWFCCIFANQNHKGYGQNRKASTTSLEKREMAMTDNKQLAKLEFVSFCIEQYKNGHKKFWTRCGTNVSTEGYHRLPAETLRGAAHAGRTGYFERD